MVKENHLTGEKDVLTGKAGTVRRHCIAMFLLVLLFSFPAAGAGDEKKAFVVPLDSDGVQRLEIVAGEYFFDPNHIVVKVNVPVEIKIRKEPSIVPHDFVLRAPEAGIDILESLGTEPKVIRLTLTAPGKYPFYCDKKLLFFKAHRERGMEGILEVQGPR